MTRNNTTFICGTTVWANACVGENGFAGYWDYAKGFSQASKLIIDSVLRGQGLTHKVDEMIYPACFNMRHSVELCLKAAIKELISIEKHRSRKIDFDLEGTHDIEKIWRFFVGKAKTVDDRYEAVICKLDEKITDIADIDKTGQTFRYPLDTESQRHLVGVSIISFEVLKGSFAQLDAALDDLRCLGDYLQSEYRCGSFTTHLSRKNLFEIACELPERATWKEKSFDTCRDKIKERFKIGSKELSLSIKLIERHREFSPRIGISIPLLGVEEDHLGEFLKNWIKRHGPHRKGRIDFSARDMGRPEAFEEILTTLETEAEIWASVREQLTPEILAGVSALFYFARNLDFSENYIETYENFLERFNLLFSTSKDSARSQYLHILNKSNAPHEILKSLYFLHKRELADLIVAKFQLDEEISWLNDARTRNLFRKMDLCGYD